MVDVKVKCVDEANEIEYDYVVRFKPAPMPGKIRTTIVSMNHPFKTVAMLGTMVDAANYDDARKAALARIGEHHPGATMKESDLRE